VVAYTGQKHIPASFIRELHLEGVQRILIKTSNSLTLGRSEFVEEYIALTPDASQALVEKGVKLLGVDGYSIGPYDPSLGMPVHSIFLGAGADQVAIEEVDLSKVEPGDYQLIALPLKLTGLEAAPTRVLLGYE
jgi:arylformamidase